MAEVVAAVSGLFAVLSWLLLLWSVLAVAPTPVRSLWKPAVAATEWGHWLGWIALVVAGVGFLADRRLSGALPAVVAAGLFHVPLVRAMGMTGGLRTGMGRLAGGKAPVRIRQRAPVVLSSLPHIPIPPCIPVRETYRRIGDLSLTLDLYLPGGGRGRARTLVLVVHGGSWSSGDSGQLAGMNRYLAGLGYTVAALNYRLAPRFVFPSPVNDIGHAIRYLGGRPAVSGWDRVVVLGRSSGGHLALLAAYQPVDPRIQGVIALYPPTDLVWSWQRPAPGRLMDSNGAIRAFMGGTPEEMLQRFVAASPLYQVRSGLPPTLLLHGGNDELVSPFQSRRLAAELKRVGAECVHIELPWGKHGMDANLAGPAGQISLYAIERFLAAADSREEV